MRRAVVAMVAVLVSACAEGQRSDGAALSVPPVAKERRLQVQVVLDGRVLSSLRLGTSRQPDDRDITLHRSISWNGYRDPPVVTRPGQTVRCSIWVAGDEREGPILGVCFFGPEGICMNTLHLARSGQASATEIEPGLMVWTSPEE